MPISLKPKRCPDCRVAPGHEHQTGCDVERCPRCGGQAISCGCRTRAKRLPWSGVWPGVAECVSFGWYSFFTPGPGWVACGKDHPEAGPDLNRLYRQAVWDAKSRSWRLPV